MAAFRLALSNPSLQLPLQQAPFSRFHLVGSPVALQPKPRLVDVLIVAQNSSTVQEDDSLVHQIQVPENHGSELYVNHQVQLDDSLLSP
jgi:hypothetical protein